MKRLVVSASFFVFLLSNIWSLMNLKNNIFFIMLLLQLSTYSQTSDTLNRTDLKGMKQGHWIKKYPVGSIQYDGFFIDNHPVGTFRRYYENDTLQSVLIFNAEGTEATGTLYHSNGYIASSGKFINQLKEGKWKFYSSRINGYLVIEEEFKGNIRHGISQKYYADKTLAEKVLFVNGIKEGEWTQYFPGGKLWLKANYKNGKLDGGFYTYFENGQPEYIGQYRDDLRSGNWKIYNSNGNLQYSFDYVDGLITDPEVARKETEYFNALEKNKGKIADPEKTGTIW
jgi:antitoxin component YwqK of YwqJK toxin-antitoxin module